LVDCAEVTVEAGEAVAVVGESGSGKSLLARAIAGLLPPGLAASGSVRLRGTELLHRPADALREVRRSDISLVLQDPFTSLHPLMRCGSQISEGSAADGLSRADRREFAQRRLREVGIDDPLVARRYPFELSGGMRQRVALAAALANEPSLLLADEFSTALDVTTQKAVWLQLRQIQSRSHMALVVITHDLRMAFAMCDRVYVMYAGSIVEAGPARLLDRDPWHPYTSALLQAEPSLDDAALARGLPGRVPPASSVHSICAFADRCSWVTPRCREEKPPLRSGAHGRSCACVRRGELEGRLSNARVTVVGPTRAAARSDRSEAIVEAVDVGKVFAAPGSRGATLALDGVSLSIAGGEAVGIVGESGSGKTTLARCMVGLEAPSTGRICVLGRDVLALARRDRRELLTDTVQYVFQDPYSSLDPTKTVGSSLSEATALAGRREEPAALLAGVGLDDSYHRCRPASLSGGERQRVAIARAIARRPRLLICDEAVSALDVSVQGQILELLSRLRSEHGFALLFISHDLAVVRHVVDTVHVMWRGQVVESGDTTQVLRAPAHLYTRELIEAVPGMWDRDTGSATRRDPQLTF
jgi:peptide/nickel transport system ATP-binding protein